MTIDPKVYGFNVECGHCRKRRFVELTDGAVAMEVAARLRAKGVCTACRDKGLPRRTTVECLWTSPLPSPSGRPV